VETAGKRNEESLCSRIPTPNPHIKSSQTHRKASVEKNKQKKKKQKKKKEKRTSMKTTLPYMSQHQLIPPVSDIRAINEWKGLITNAPHLG